MNNKEKILNCIKNNSPYVFIYPDESWNPIILTNAPYSKLQFIALLLSNASNDIAKGNAILKEEGNEN